MNDATQHDATPTKRWSLLALIGFLAGLSAAGTVLVSAMGYRLGWWHFTTGLQIFEWAVYGAAAAFLLSIAGMVAARARRRGLIVAILGVVLASPVLGMGIHWEYAARAYPPINDITTDTENPPEFWEVPNPVVYPGPEAAALQREAYPDLQPLLLALPPDDAFEQALTLVRKMGWEVVSADEFDGQIEAVAETRLFGFKDNVAVRIRAEGDHSQVDMRSHSRIGRIDRGTNAKRIRAYLAALEKQVAGLQ